MSVKISKRDVTLKSGQLLTEADFERMALDAETATPDYEAILERTGSKGGRPSLGRGRSRVLQVRLDEDTSSKLADRAEHDHTTPSKIVRDALQAWLNAS
jgi:hypothetical protein